MCAGIYCARRALKTLIIERRGIGGAMLWSEDIDNYPGLPSSTGADISKKMEDHCRKSGAQFLMDSVERIDAKGATKKVKTTSKTVSCKSIIICTGGSPRKLGVAGEERLRGKGVSYCATCDAPLFKGKTVAVVGGGSTAVTEAIYLSKIAKKVYLIHRRESLRAEHADIEKLEKAGVKKVLNATVKEVKGTATVESLLVETPRGRKEVRVDGVFIQVGTDPETGLAKQAGATLDANGFVTVDANQATTVPGMFAAGDVTGGIEQIATAVGQGCVAALSAYTYLEKPYWATNAYK